MPMSLEALEAIPQECMFQVKVTVTTTGEGVAIENVCQRPQGAFAYMAWGKEEAHTLHLFLIVFHCVGRDDRSTCRQRVRCDA